MNGVARYLSTAALTSVMSMMLFSAMLPKGMKLTDFPKLITAAKQMQGGVSAQNIFDIMENEDRLAFALKGINPDDPSENKSTAVAAKPESVVIDQQELDSLEDMNISKELKDQIRQNYAQVGSIQGAKIERARDHVEPQAADAKTASPERSPASVEAVVTASNEPPKSYAESLGKLHAALTRVEHKPTN